MNVVRRCGKVVHERDGAPAVRLARQVPVVGRAVVPVDARDGVHGAAAALYRTT